MSTVLDPVKEDMINDVLESMLNVDGLDGAMAISPEGGMLGAVMPGIYDDDSLLEVSGMIGNTLATLKELKIRPTDMTYRYAGIRLLITDLRKGYLLIMSQPTISAPLLSIATNVARKKLVNILSDKVGGASASGVKVKRSRKRTKKVEDPVNDGTAQPQAQAEIASAGPQLATGVGPQFSTGTVASGSGASGGTGEPLIINESELALPPRQAVFIAMLRSLSGLAQREDISARDAMQDAIVKAFSDLGVHAAVVGVVQQWVANSDQILEVDLTEQQMQAVIHSLYIFLCEYFGPVACDQMIARSQRAIRKLAAASQYSPNNLLY